MPLVLKASAAPPVQFYGASRLANQPLLSGAGKESPGINAMFLNLWRWRGCAGLWQHSQSCRMWREKVVGGIADEHNSHGHRLENHCWRTRSVVRASSTALGGPNLGFCQGEFRSFRQWNASDECREPGCGYVASRQLGSLVCASHGCSHVCYGWQGRRRKSGFGEFSNSRKYHLESISHESRPLKRAAGHASASVKTSESQAGIRRGALLEFERESGQVVLAVAQSRDGKKNWMAMDQNGNMHSVRPQQITYLVPGLEDFEPSDIAKFLSKVENLQDLGLLEFAWEEVSAEEAVQTESLAKVLYSKGTPAECYCVHRMLSSNQLYFRRRQQGLTPVYEPRPLSQVRELQQKRIADERAREELLSYVKAINLALQFPQNDKPSEKSWHQVGHFHIRTEALKAYALGSQSDPAQKKTAEEVLEAMGLAKNPPAVVNMLIGMGVFPLHVNVELLKINELVEFTKEHIAAVEQLHQSPQVDPDADNRVDLTDLKVYTIDSDDTDEIDDGLSATRLSDGRIKVWIHVADPTRWLPHDHILSREAEYRGTSIYLPTGTIPMFPMELAAGAMSLKQGYKCPAVTVSVILMKDGSIADYSVMNSVIHPTYKLSYDNVAELLAMNVEEEPELYLLAEAANCRANWRLNQGAVVSNAPEAELKVTDLDSPDPSITLEVKDQSVPAMQLVAEMMILCGEAIALIGEENALTLPYRGQAPTELPARGLSNIPEGPCRAFAIRRLLGSADMSFSKPIAHASLGLTGYVQFTSPIRRLSDLLAHYQVKAYLRGEVPPFTRGSLEAKMAKANIRTKEARKLQSASVRYWTLEYLRRQPRDRQYKAVVLRYTKDREASVLILEVALRGNVSLQSSPAVGSEVVVFVHLADPRKDTLILRQCLT